MFNNSYDGVIYILVPGGKIMNSHRVVEGKKEVGYGPTRKIEKFRTWSTGDPASKSLYRYYLLLSPILNTIF
jgi:hypothetical protein